MTGFPDGPFHRRTARVLLVNGEDRLLLFKFYGNRKKNPDRFYWLTPGGGVDEGEPLHHAAARELREETGLVVAPDELGGLIALTGGYADLGWAKGDFREDFYFHRIVRHEVDLSGLEDYEHEQLVEHRWWSVDELATTEDRVYPLELAPLVSRLIAGDIPAEPVLLPWHH